MCVKILPHLLCVGLVSLGVVSGLGVCAACHMMTKHTYLSKPNQTIIAMMVWFGSITIWLVGLVTVAIDALGLDVNQSLFWMLQGRHCDAMWVGGGRWQLPRFQSENVGSVL